MTQPVVPTNGGWLRKWFRLEPHMIVGGSDNPYLLRWYVIPRNPVLNVYLHKFLRSDDDQALHDHPWWFVSLILKGRYAEISEKPLKIRTAGSLAFRRSSHRHRVELLCPPATMAEIAQATAPRDLVPCWTVIVTGRKVREWGFWCYSELTESARWISRAYQVPARLLVPPPRFIPWKQWDSNAGCGEV